MRYLSFLVTVMLVFLNSIVYGAQFNSGSTGADGAFNPTTNTELQLPPDGIFNFVTVNIPSGVTVTFKKNTANTPVYILTTGNVTIAGTINLNGSSAYTIQSGFGGPGGFDGGFGGTQSIPGSKGVGPGGGNPCTNPTTACGASGGGFGSAGSVGSYNSPAGGVTYGNERLIPLIGGSGGGGGIGTSDYTGGAGGGGGGAILIASSGTITVTGTLTANGGNGATSANSGGGGGSGGAIKLMANTIAGNGTISASSGAGGGVGGVTWPGGTGGNGRIRLEANILNRTSGATPSYTFGYPGPVFVANMPSLQITSVGGVNVPSTPTGSYATPDIKLPAGTTNPVAVTLSASNIPVGTTVTVSVIPQFGTATNVNTTLSGTTASSTATASVNLSTQCPYILTATATFTVQIAMYFDGEKIEKVTVASTMGKGSKVTYITESGKEIPAEKLLAWLVKQ